MDPSCIGLLLSAASAATEASRKGQREDPEAGGKQPGGRQWSDARRAAVWPARARRSASDHAAQSGFTRLPMGLATAAAPAPAPAEEARV
jgi:hypothetical protein